MDLIEFVKKLFTAGHEEFCDIPDSIKNKHFFMSIRFLSIKMPTIAYNYSRIGVNQAACLEMINVFLKKQYNGQPSWLWTKPRKTKNIFADKLEKDTEKFSKEAVTFFAEKHQLGTRDLEFIKKEVRPFYIEHLTKIDKLLKELD